MKKEIISTLCLSAVLVSGTAFANTLNKSFGGINLKVNTPDISTAKNTKAAKANTSLSKSQAAMKSQINTMINKMNNTSKNYESAVNSIVNNMLPSDEVKKYKEERAKLAKNGAFDVQIDVAEDGVVQIKKYLKTKNATEELKNLSATKKANIKNSLNKLSGVNSTYTQLASDSKTLLKQVKADPVAAALMANDFKNLAKANKAMLKQSKNIVSITKTIASTSSEAGVNLK